MALKVGSPLIEGALLVVAYSFAGIVVWHALTLLIAAVLFFLFTLPRWWEFAGSVSHTTGTVLRIVTSWRAPRTNSVAGFGAAGCTSIGQIAGSWQLDGTNLGRAPRPTTGP